MRPGPKSRSQGKNSAPTKQLTPTLGDEAVNTSSDSELSGCEGGFQTPEPLNDATDYGLDFTSSQIKEPMKAIQRKGGSNARNFESRHVSLARQQRSEAENTIQTRTTSNIAPSTSRRKQAQPAKNCFRDYKKLMENVNFMIPRLPFGRLVRQILLSFTSEVTRVTPVALEALQTATEAYVTQRLEDAYLLTLHRGRVTLSIQDMLLINHLRTIKL